MYHPTGRIAPQALERAIVRYRSAFPDDGNTIDRLWQSLAATQPQMAEIRDAICEFFVIEPHDLVSRRREAEMARARQLFCYFSYRYTRFPLLQIGGQVGLGHHTTVAYAVKKIEKSVITTPTVRDDVDLLLLRISEKVLRRLDGVGHARP